MFAIWRPGLGKYSTGNYRYWLEEDLDLQKAHVWTRKSDATNCANKKNRLIKQQFEKTDLYQSAVKTGQPPPQVPDDWLYVPIEVKLVLAHPPASTANAVEDPPQEEESPEPLIRFQFNPD